MTARGVAPGYAAGSLVTGAYATVPGLLLLPYLTDTLGVAAGLAGLVVFLPKVWSVLLAPVAGRASDRTRSRWGPRRPWVLGAGLAVAAAFALMFAAPVGGAPGLAWVVVGHVLLGTAFAGYLAPYAAMPAEMADGAVAVTRLMSWRVAGIAVAALVSGAAAPALVRAGGGGLAGHRLMGVAVAAVIAVGAVTAVVGTRRAPQRAAPAVEPSLRRQLAVARSSGPLRTLLAVVLAQSAATAALLAGVPYLTAGLGAPDLTAGVVVAFAAPALTLPLLLRRALAADPRRGVLAASAVHVVACPLLLPAAATGPGALLVLAAVLGCANAVQDVFVLALLPARIAEETARTGRRQAGVFAGLFSAAQGLGFALGPLAFGLVLQAGGYQPSATGTAAAQSATATAAVQAGVALLPALLTAVSVVVLLRRPPARPPRPARRSGAAAGPPSR